MATRSKRQYVALLKTLGAGLVLAGVPTYYTVFAEQASNDPRRIRVIVFGIWILIGFYVLWRARDRDEAIEQAMADRRAVQRDLRTSATYDVLRALTQPGVMGLPRSYELTLYLYDKTVDSLEPYYPHLDLPAGREDPRRFKPGRGATGRAWEAGRLFYVRGEPVATDEYELTEEQRSYYKDYRSVAATPIHDEQGKRFGVVTALSRQDDGIFEHDKDGPRRLRDIADTFGVVLKSVPDPADLVTSEQ